jgi:hypothetical protein
MASARHRGALVVRARSRVSASAVHAHGRRDRDALRSSSALRTNPTSRTSCLVCSQRGNPKRLSPPNLPRSEACASCPLSATFRADHSLDALPDCSGDSSGGRTPEGSGPADAERGWGNARFTTRGPPGESIEIAWGVFVLARVRSDCALGVSVASFAAIAIGISPNGIALEGRRDRVGMRARESRPHTSSIRDTFHRQEPHAPAHAANHVREPHCLRRETLRSLLLEAGALT